MGYMTTAPDHRAAGRPSLPPFPGRVERRRSEASLAVRRSRNAVPAVGRPDDRARSARRMPHTAHSCRPRTAPMRRAPRTRRPVRCETAEPCCLTDQLPSFWPTVSPNSTSIACDMSSRRRSRSSRRWRSKLRIGSPIGGACASRGEWSRSVQRVGGGLHHSPPGVQPVRSRTEVKVTLATLSMASLSEVKSGSQTRTLRGRSAHRKEYRSFADPSSKPWQPSRHVIQPTALAAPCHRLRAEAGADAS